MPYPKQRVYVSGRPFDIPYDPKTGKVPESELVARFNRTFTGGKPGHDRDRLKDYNDRADVVMPSKLTPEQAKAWWANPNLYDIEYIDAPGPAKHDPGKRHGVLKDAHQDIGVIGTDADEKRVRGQLDASFSPRELSTMAAGGAVITVRPLPRQYTGLFKRAGSQILVDRERGDTATLAHEGSHMMRYGDGSRSGITASSEKENVEESCTVAEQQARTKRSSCSGYYTHVKVKDKKTARWRNPTYDEAVKMAEEDHRLFTEGKGKLYGHDAVRSVNEHWADSNIARLSYKSNGRMAINTVAATNKSFHPTSWRAKGAFKPKIGTGPSTVTNKIGVTAIRPIEAWAAKAVGKKKRRLS